MNFLAPLAFFFAAALPVVILFYLLKRRRTVHLVSSTLLWQRFLAETQASAPFQRLRHNWLLLLQLLMLALAILALARPYFAATAKSGRSFVVILDASASMQSADVEPTRFDAARRDALKLVDSMRDDDRMVVLLAAAQTEVKQSPTREKTALRRALNTAAPADTPTQLKESLRLADTWIRSNPKAEIHLFSDGAARDLEEFADKKLPIVYHRIGERGANLGVIHLEVRTHPENPGQRAAFVTVQNSSTNAQTAGVEFRFNDRVVEVKNLEVPARNQAPAVFALDQVEDGIVSVHLAGRDDLAVDDQAYAVSQLPKPNRVLLVSPGNQFLERALRSAPYVDLTVAPTYSPGLAADIVVLDNIAPDPWPEFNVLSFRAAQTNWFAPIPLSGPPIVDWKSGHPLLRFVTFDNVLIAESFGVNPPNWAISLVNAPQYSLILGGELGRQRVVWVGFDILQSTWPLRVSFPIFIANAMDWLSPASRQAAELTTHSGEPVRFPLPDPDLTAATVTLPNGTAVPQTLSQPGEFSFGGTGQAGLYRIRAGTNHFVFAVNLADAWESDTTPQTELKLGEYVRVSDSVVRTANVELWRWLAAIALGVLSFEWWYYHRRTA